MTALDLNAQVLDPHSCAPCADAGRRAVATHLSAMPWGTVVYLCDACEAKRPAKEKLWRSVLAELRGGL